VSAVRTGVHMSVPCGKCLGCLQRKRADWTQRIAYEEKKCKSSSFITLTYDEFHVPYTDNGNLTLKKSDLQKFFKRVRTPGLIFFAVGEYGSRTLRPHYHAAVFNSTPDRLYDAWSIYGDRLGDVQIGDVNPASIHYLTKYMVNDQEEILDALKPFRLMSKGLGKGLANELEHYCHNNKSNIVRAPGGQQIVLPRYIGDKIFSSAQRSEIARKAQENSDKNRETSFDVLVKHRDYMRMLAQQTSKSRKC